MKSFKYTTIFSSLKIKPLVAEEKDKYLALASLVDVGNFVPNIDLNKNVDLLPIAFNACVVNRVNKNGDAIDEVAAVDMYKSFVNKPINIEHNRQKVVGTILTASFSEFGTDAPLTEEKAKEMKGPFNITLGGVIWRVVNDQLANIIENSNDPTSEDYQKVSASWELGFSKYNILLMEGEEKNIENAEIVKEDEKMEKLFSCLKSLGGSGKTDCGKNVYRQVVGDVVPLGIGLTECPAADVIGVAVAAAPVDEIGSANETGPVGEMGQAGITEEEAINEEIKAGDSKILKFIEYMKENSSQTTEVDVKNTDKAMKINSLLDITDESMKELTASAVSTFIEEELKKASELFNEKHIFVEVSLNEAKEKNASLVIDFNKIKEELEKVQATLVSLEAQKALKDDEERFNTNMAKFDIEFDLDEEDRTVIASDIKDLNEEAFSAYHTKMSKLLKNKKKTSKGLTKSQEKLPDFIKEKIEEKEKKEACASEEEIKQVVEKALDSAKAEVMTVPASSTAKEPTVFEKYRKAFDMEQFVFKK